VLRAGAAGVLARHAPAPEALALLVGTDRELAAGAAEALSGGLPEPVAAELLRRLAADGGLGQGPALRALEGLRPTLPTEDVARLARLSESARGEPREALTLLLGRLDGALPALLARAPGASPAERRLLATVAVLRADGAALSRALVTDPDPRVRLVAVQGLRPDVDAATLRDVALGDGAALVRASALSVLARGTGPEGAAPETSAQPLVSCELARSAYPAVRLAALSLLLRRDLDCPELVAEDLVLLEREPAVRSIAAAALWARGAGERERRVCAIYDPDAEVAAACRAAPASAEVPMIGSAGRTLRMTPAHPWSVRPAPGVPAAWLWPDGSLGFGVTTGAGALLVPGAVQPTLLPQRLAL
jgi:hypothetical protein